MHVTLLGAGGDKMLQQMQHSRLKVNFFKSVEHCIFSAWHTWAATEVSATIVVNKKARHKAG